jgi:hypothetical protein
LLGVMSVGVGGWVGGWVGGVQVGCGVDITGEILQTRVASRSAGCAAAWAQLSLNLTLTHPSHTPHTPHTHPSGCGSHSRISTSQAWGSTSWPTPTCAMPNLLLPSMQRRTSSRYLRGGWCVEGGRHAATIGGRGRMRAGSMMLVDAGTLRRPNTVHSNAEPAIVEAHHTEEGTALLIECCRAK